MMKVECIQIDRAKLSDFEFIHDFINALENTVFDKKRQQDIYNENILNPRNIYLLASYESKPIGYLSCHVQGLLHHGGLVGEIQEMYVAEGVRKFGVGTFLIEHLKSIAFAHKIIQLEVTSNLKRELAHHFYQRNGFNYTHKKLVWSDSINKQVDTNDNS